MFCELMLAEAACMGLSQLHMHSAQGAQKGQHVLTDLGIAAEQGVHCGQGGSQVLVAHGLEGRNCIFQAMALTVCMYQRIVAHQQITMPAISPTQALGPAPNRLGTTQAAQQCGPTYDRGMCTARKMLPQTLMRRVLNSLERHPTCKQSRCTGMTDGELPPGALTLPNNELELRHCSCSDIRMTCSRAHSPLSRLGLAGAGEAPEGGQAGAALVMEDLQLAMRLPDEGKSLSSGSGSTGREQSAGQQRVCVAASLHGRPQQLMSPIGSLTAPTQKGSSQGEAVSCGDEPVHCQQVPLSQVLLHLAITAAVRLCKEAPDHACSARSCTC